MYNLNRIENEVIRLKNHKKTLIISLVCFVLISITLILFFKIKNFIDEAPVSPLENFGVSDPVTFIDWESRGYNPDDPYYSYQYAVLWADSNRVDEVHIWATKEPNVYCLSINLGYIKCNYKTGEWIDNKDLDCFAEEDQVIFKKLENHPELFLERQHLNNDHRVYTGSRGKGRLKLSD